MSYHQFPVFCPYCKKMAREKELLGADLQRLEEERDCLRRQLQKSCDKSMVDCETVKRQFIEYENTIRKLEMEIRDLTHCCSVDRQPTLAALEERCETYRIQVRDVEEELCRQRSLYDQLRQIHTQTERQVEEAQKQLRKVELELSDVKQKQRLKSLSELNESNKEVETLQCDLSIMKKQLSLLDKEKDELLNILDDKTELIAQLQHDIKQKNMKIDELECTLKQLKIDFGVVQEENQSKESLLKSSHIQMEQMRHQLDSAGRRGVDCQAENKRLEEELACACSEVRQTKKSLEISERKVEELKCQLQHYIAEVKRAEDLMSQKVNSEVNALKSSNMELQSAINKERRNSEELECLLKETRAESVRLKLRIEELEDENAELKKKIEDLETKLYSCLCCICDPKKSPRRQSPKRLRGMQKEIGPLSHSGPLIFEEMEVLTPSHSFDRTNRRSDPSHGSRIPQPQHRTSLSNGRRYSSCNDSTRYKEPMDYSFFNGRTPRFEPFSVSRTPDSLNRNRINATSTPITGRRRSMGETNHRGSYEMSSRNVAASFRPSSASTSYRSYMATRGSTLEPEAPLDLTCCPPPPACSCHPCQFDHYLPVSPFLKELQERRDNIERESRRLEEERLELERMERENMEHEAMERERQRLEEEERCEWERQEQLRQEEEASERERQKRRQDCRPCYSPVPPCPSSGRGREARREQSSQSRRNLSAECCKNQDRKRRESGNQTFRRRESSKKCQGTREECVRLKEDKSRKKLDSERRNQQEGRNSCRSTRSLSTPGRQSKDLRQDVLFEENESPSQSSTSSLSDQICQSPRRVAQRKEKEKQCFYCREKICKCELSKRSKNLKDRNRSCCSYEGDNSKNEATRRTSPKKCARKTSKKSVCESKRGKNVKTPKNSCECVDFGKMTQKKIRTQKCGTKRSRDECAQIETESDEQEETEECSETESSSCDADTCQYSEGKPVSQPNAQTANRLCSFRSVPKAFACGTATPEWTCNGIHPNTKISRLCQNAKAAELRVENCPGPCGNVRVSRLFSTAPAVKQPDAVISNAQSLAVFHGNPNLKNLKKEINVKICGNLVKAVEGAPSTFRITKNE